MKPVSNLTEYVANFIAKRYFLMADLYTFTLKSGDVARYTNLDFDLLYAGDRYKGNSIIIEGLQYKTSVGWNADEQDVKVTFLPGNLMSGSDFGVSVFEGLLSGATVVRQRAFWKSTNAVAMIDFQNTPDEVFTLFTGYVSEISKIGRTTIEFKVASIMKILDMDMPRNNYQSGCQWSLFDAGCTLNRADYVSSGTVEALVGDYGVSMVGGILSSVGLDGDPYYAQGRLEFTSGARDGLTLTLRTNDDTTFYFMYPPIVDVAPGDTFNVWPGCSKRTDTCSKKFQNLVNHRGFPRVPPIHVSA